MGFRFRKSIRILPGVRWNIGTSSSSFSFGGRGLTHTVGTKGSRTTIGIPGTGLSYSKNHKTARSVPVPIEESPTRAPTRKIWRTFWIVGSILFVVWILFPRSPAKLGYSSIAPTFGSPTAVPATTQTVETLDAPAGNIATLPVTPAATPILSEPLRALPADVPREYPAPRRAPASAARVDLPSAAKRKITFAPAPSDYGQIRRSAPRPEVRFRIRFANGGEVMRVTLVKSSGSRLLDAHAVKTLQQWRASAGHEWETGVSITF